MSNGNKLTQDQVSVLMNEGTFRGLKTLRASRRISETEAAALLHRSYGALLEEIKEARKELAHLQNALSAMESSARAGMQAKAGPGAEMAQHQFTNNLITFDAWVVSLVESDLTMTGMLNPSHTRKKITEMAAALNALMDKRAAAGHPLLAAPELFRNYIDR